MFGPDLMKRAEALVAACRAKDLTLTTAESCTGGLVAALLTEVAGSSTIFGRGFVTYSNQAKTELLGVDADSILRDGAVAESTARAMAKGALDRAHADIAVSITGIAGPGGGSEAKPVGLVHFACSSRGGETRHLERRFGPLGRSAVRLASVDQALRLLEEAVAAAPAGPARP